MRFRKKFGLLDWCIVGVGAIWAYIWVSGLNSFTLEHRAFAATPWIVWALIRVTSYFVVYWDLDSVSLRAHSMWSKEEVQWAEVTRVGGIRPNQPYSDALVVHFVRTRETTPYTGRDRIVAIPEDRNQFIAALRRFAPHATFDV